MKKLSLLLGLAVFTAFAHVEMPYGPLGIDQFPEDDKYYTPKKDTGFAKYLTKSARGTKKIALTFDDGPHPTRTPRLLNILKKHDVQATFFVVTEKITKDTQYIVEQMLLDGHYVASHHHKHINSDKQNKTTWTNYLTTSVKQIESIEEQVGVFQNQMYYRFPYGAYGKNATYHHLNVMKEVSNNLYGKNCINFAFWDVDTVDWLAKMTAENIKDNVLAQTEGGRAYRHKYVNGKYIKQAYTVTKPIGGGVVLMHDIHQRSVDATELLLEHIEDNQNLEVVPLDHFDEFQYGDLECLYRL